jgi:tetratricopeptide (TPR) repeat protein
MRYLLIIFVFLSLFLSTNTCLAGETTLNKAWIYYAQGDYKRAIDACRIVSSSRMLGDKGRYVMGLAQLKSGKADDARKNFNFVLDNYPKSGMKDELLLGVADSYFVEANYAKAKEYYKILLRTIPDTNYASMVYLRLGQCQKKLGEFDQAKSTFHKITRDYPFSLEAKEAKENIGHSDYYFTVQAGAFSKEENANRLCDSLKSRGYDAYVERLQKKDMLMYCVRIGRFKSQQQAKVQAERLKKQGYSVRICP